MPSDLLEQGAYLMMYGMGTVFVFLTVLVLATLSMSYVIQNLLPETLEPALIPSTMTDNPKASVVDNKTLDLIKQGIAQHRSKHA